MLVRSDSHARMGILAIEKQPIKRPLLDARNGRGVPMEMARSQQHQDEVCLSFRCFHEDITILTAISQGANVLKSHELPGTVSATRRNVKRPKFCFVMLLRNQRRHLLSNVQ